MSRKELKKSVIHYLQHLDYKYIKCLGDGGFGSVIAMLTPNNEKIAIKIVENDNIWFMEDEFWPRICHPHLLPMTNTMTIEQLNVKLYFMPILPKVLIDTLFEEEFKRDPNSFNRVKKWFRQILSALAHLHASGFCHLDIKADNILLDDEDNAVVCDFSGLNYTNVPVHRLCAPLNYRPRECFPDHGQEMDIQGKPFDLWSFSLLALNALTGHYPELKGPKVELDTDWDKEVWPFLETTLQESKLRSLIKESFPNAFLTDCDIHEAQHFLQFIMKIRPDERPSASRIKKHPFLKKESNPFLKDWNETFWRKSNSVNPFQTMLSLESKSDDKREESIVNAEPPSQLNSSTTEEYLTDANPEVIINPENCVTDMKSPDPQNSLRRTGYQNNTFGKNVKNWFQKKFNRILKRKKKYVKLSEDWSEDAPKE